MKKKKNEQKKLLILKSKNKKNNFSLFGYVFFDFSNLNNQIYAQ